MKRQMTYGEAVLELVQESRKERITKTGYYRAVRAVNTLNLTVEESNKILHDMEFTDSEGMPRTYLLNRGVKQ